MTFKPKPRSKKKPKVFSVVLPPEMYKRLTATAKKNNLQVATLVRQMIFHCLEDEK